MRSHALDQEGPTDTTGWPEVVRRNCQGNSAVASGLQLYSLIYIYTQYTPQYSLVYIQIYIYMYPNIHEIYTNNPNIPQAHSMSLALNMDRPISHPDGILGLVSLFMMLQRFRRPVTEALYPLGLQITQRRYYL